MTLRELRKSRGLTLAQISEQLGVPAATYHRWESGKIKPSGESLVKIAETLRVDIRISFESGEIEFDVPTHPQKQTDYPEEVWDAALRFASEVHGIYHEEE